MILKEVHTKQDLRAFYAIANQVYAGNECYRPTDRGITRLVIEGPTAFHFHASVRPFLIQEGCCIVGRFAFIQDDRLSNTVQVSFFEAMPGLGGIVDCITKRAHTLFRQCKRIVFGLNGHENYGAGFLLNRFDEVPVFALPYSPPYYCDYFKGLTERGMASFRYPNQPFYAYRAGDTGRNNGALTVRTMRRSALRRDIAIYTHLNNACFRDEPYWTDRSVDEDRELFWPVRFLIREENLLFAELHGEPIGFLLWYPDFNQLVHAGRELGCWAICRYRLADPIDTVRLAQIAVHPKHRARGVFHTMMLAMASLVERHGYRWHEGGFIFEENRRSMATAKRYAQRTLGQTVEPYRRYAIFEGAL